MTAPTTENMTGDERCKALWGFESFKQKLYPEVFGEKIRPVENAEVAFVNGKPKFFGRSTIGLVEFTVNISTTPSRWRTEEVLKEMEFPGASGLSSPSWRRAGSTRRALS